ncbi:SLATT domain-containing protein [Janthinobacterium sp. GMG1]|jgi:hypothetical protein|uniref:SLATT domain-containing protein n=1 Tax=Janthinobacterium sp. GMG1 TaxID=3096007 RepID=UPI002ACA6F5D|nr:SLATT domain-containing protein [Janthinobacterium sp. GMG1]MDZ5636238.1 SLATT domain-containing protein [Janthinobacterium sp. GMG1]
MTLRSLDELESLLARQIERFNQRRRDTRKWKNFLFNAQVSCASLTTFIIAANIKFGNVELNIVAAGLSVLATSFGIFQTSYRFHDRLHAFTLTSSQLQGILARLKLQRLKHADDPIACPLNTATVDHLFQEMEITLTRSNEQWSNMMMKNKPKASLDDLFKDPNSQQE